MRTKKVTRYYCEFCSKGSFTKPSMMNHEARCCKNPNRDCGVCGETKTNVVKNAARLATKGVDALSELVGGCPACILAAHIAASDRFGSDTIEYYDYHGAMQIWFDRHHDEAGRFDVNLVDKKVELVKASMKSRHWKPIAISEPQGRKFDL